MKEAMLYFRVIKFVDIFVFLKRVYFYCNINKKNKLSTRKISNDNRRINDTLIDSGFAQNIK